MPNVPFAPTGVQLSAAIAEEFERSKKSTVILAVDELRSKLLEHHPDWKIPDRRVKKFLKRHLRKNHGNPSDDDHDDDESTVASSVPFLKSPFKSPGKRLRSILGFHRHSTTTSSTEKVVMTRNNAPESAPESLLPPLASEASSPKCKSDIIESKVEDRPSQSEQVRLELTRSDEQQVYRDDNDGSKSKDCCRVEACAIM